MYYCFMNNQEMGTIIYLVNGERYRDASGLLSMLGSRLAEIRSFGFRAWIEKN